MQFSTHHDHDSCKTYSRAAIGIQAPLITVEADISTGLPQVVIVGLPELR